MHINEQYYYKYLKYKTKYTQLITQKGGYNNASHGFIATLDNPLIRDSKGNTVFDTSNLNFVNSNQMSPSTVN